MIDTRPIQNIHISQTGILVIPMAYCCCRLMVTDCWLRVIGCKYVCLQHYNRQPTTNNHHLISTLSLSERHCDAEGNVSIAVERNALLAEFAEDMVAGKEKIDASRMPVEHPSHACTKSTYTATDS